MMDADLTTRMAALDEGRRQAFLRDATRLVETEVESRSGVTGLAIKGAYRVARALRADFLGAALERLLPTFTRALDPIASEKGPGQPFEDLFSRRADEVAGALLRATDEKVASSSTSSLRAAYQKASPLAKRIVAQAAPRIGRLLDIHGL